MNAFLSAFICAFGLAGLTASLRMSVTANKGKWSIVNYGAKVREFIIFS